MAETGIEWDAYSEGAMCAAALGTEVCVLAGSKYRGVRLTRAR